MFSESSDTWITRNERGFCKGVPEEIEFPKEGDLKYENVL